MHEHVFLFRSHIYCCICNNDISILSYVNTQTELITRKTTIKRFFNLSQEALREHLFNEDIYKGKKRMSKSDLVDIVITGVPRNIKNFVKEGELTMDKALKILNNNDAYNI